MRKRPFAGAVERELKRNEATRCESSSSSTAEAIRGSARTTASRGRVRCRAVPKQFVRCCCCGLAFLSQFLGGPLGSDSDSDSASKWFGVKLNQSWPQLLNAIIIISSGAESFNQCQCSISISLSIVLKFDVICHNCGHATLVTRWPTGPVHSALITVPYSQYPLPSTHFPLPTVFHIAYLTPPHLTHAPSPWLITLSLHSQFSNAFWEFYFGILRCKLEFVTGMSRRWCRKYPAKIKTVPTTTTSTSAPLRQIKLPALWMGTWRTRRTCVWVELKLKAIYDIFLAVD